MSKYTEMRNDDGITDNSLDTIYASDINYIYDELKDIAEKEGIPLDEYTLKTFIMNKTARKITYTINNNTIAVNTPNNTIIGVYLNEDIENINAENIFVNGVLKPLVKLTDAYDNVENGPFVPDSLVYLYVAIDKVYIMKLVSKQLNAPEKIYTNILKNESITYKPNKIPFDKQLKIDVGQTDLLYIIIRTNAIVFEGAIFIYNINNDIDIDVYEIYHDGLTNIKFGKFLSSLIVDTNIDESELILRAIHGNEPTITQTSTEYTKVYELPHENISKVSPLLKKILNARAGLYADSGDNEMDRQIVSKDNILYMDRYIHDDNENYLMINRIVDNTTVSFLIGIEDPTVSYKQIDNVYIFQGFGDLENPNDITNEIINGSNYINFSSAKNDIENLETLSNSSNASLTNTFDVNTTFDTLKLDKDIITPYGVVRKKFTDDTLYKKSEWNYNATYIDGITTNVVDKFLNYRKGAVSEISDNKYIKSVTVDTLSISSYYYDATISPIYLVNKHYAHYKSANFNYVLDIKSKYLHRWYATTTDIKYAGCTNDTIIYYTENTIEFYNDLNKYTIAHSGIAKVEIIATDVIVITDENRKYVVNLKDKKHLDYYEILSGPDNNKIQSTDVGNYPLVYDGIHIAKQLGQDIYIDDTKIHTIANGYNIVQIFCYKDIVYLLADNDQTSELIVISGQIKNSIIFNGKLDILPYIDRHRFRSDDTYMEISETGISYISDNTYDIGSKIPGTLELDILFDDSVLYLNYGGTIKKGSVSLFENSTTLATRHKNEYLDTLLCDINGENVIFNMKSECRISRIPYSEIFFMDKKARLIKSSSDGYHIDVNGNMLRQPITLNKTTTELLDVNGTLENVDNNSYLSQDEKDNNIYIKNILHDKNNRIVFKSNGIVAIYPLNNNSIFDNITVMEDVTYLLYSNNRLIFKKNGVIYALGLFENPSISSVSEPIDINEILNSTGTLNGTFSVINDTLQYTNNLTGDSIQIDDNWFEEHRDEYRVNPDIILNTNTVDGKIAIDNRIYSYTNYDLYFNEQKYRIDGKDENENFKI